MQRRDGAHIEHAGESAVDAQQSGADRDAVTTRDDRVDVERRLHQALQMRGTLRWR